MSFDTTRSYLISLFFPGEGFAKALHRYNQVSSMTYDQNKALQDREV
jgi:hypothetical protein